MTIPTTTHIRTAFWTGTVRAGAENQFRDLINLTLLPAFRQLPGVKAAHAWWPEKLEDSPPAVACQFVIEYASRDDLDRMLASPDRLALRPHVAEAKGLFEGHVSHIEYAAR